MKRKIIVSIIVSAVLIMALLLTSCGNTNGGGTFTQDNGDGTSDNISFAIHAQASGAAYTTPVGDELDIPGEPTINFQYVYFQPAKGTAVFTDTTSNVRIMGTIDGTFALASDKTIEDVIPGYPLEEGNFSMFTGTCTVANDPDLNGSGPYYMLIYSGDSGNTPNSDGVNIEVFSEPIITDGTLNTTTITITDPTTGETEQVIRPDMFSDPALEWGATIKGNINIFTANN